MLKKILLFPVIAIIIACALHVSPAHADNPVYQQPGKDGGIVHITSPGQVSGAVTGFYKVYARWPKNWQEVLDSDIFQFKVLDMARNEVQPDLKTLSSKGDLHYEYDAESDIASIVVSLNDNGSYTHTEVLTKPMSYVELFTMFDSNHDENDPQSLSYMELYGNDEDKLKLFAIISQCMMAISLYEDITGTLPETIWELGNEGLGPLGAFCINPVTGEPLLLDGSPGNVQYRKVETGGYIFRHIDEDPAKSLQFSY